MKSRLFILLLVSHFFLDLCIGIWPLYKTIAHLEIAKAGLIMGAAGFIGEMTQLFFGLLSDQGRRKQLLILGLLLASSIFFVTFCNGYLGLMGIMLCLMIGSGAYHPSAAGFASQLSHEKGRPLLLFTACGALGLGLSQVIFSQTLKVFNGHAFVLLVPLALIIGLWVFHKSPQDLSTKRASPAGIFKTFAKHRRSLSLLYLVQVITYGVVLSLVFLLPDLLRSKGSSEFLCMGGGHLALILGSVLGMITLSFFTQKWGYKNTLLLAASLGLLLFSSFLFTPLASSWITTLLLVSIGASLLAMNPLIVAWGNALIPESPSSVSGLLMGFAWGFANLFPIVAGFLSAQSHSSYLSTIALFSPLLLVGIIGILLIPAPKRAFSEGALL
ncbi:MAG: hypothetical protein KR126chlam1_01183 [Chlamydiae bacterium]|nr:hypothetical protein [Chlamydiota bacterium]